MTKLQQLIDTQQIFVRVDSKAMLGPYKLLQSEDQAVLSLTWSASCAFSAFALDRACCIWEAEAIIASSSASRALFANASFSASAL